MRRSSSRSRSTTSRGSTSSSSSTTTASGLQLDGFCPQASPPTPSAARALPRGQSVYSTPFFSFGTLQLSPLSQLRSAFRTVPQRSFSFQDRHCGATTPVPEKGRHSSLLSPPNAITPEKVQEWAWHEMRPRMWFWNKWCNLEKTPGQVQAFFHVTEEEVQFRQRAEQQRQEAVGASDPSTQH